MLNRQEVCLIFISKGHTERPVCRACLRATTTPRVTHANDDPPTKNKGSRVGVVRIGRNLAFIQDKVFC